MLSSLLAHAADGLSGDGVSGPLLYGLAILGPLIATLGLRARGTAPLGSPTAAPLTADGAESGPWPGDGAPAAVRAVGHAIGLTGLGAVLVVAWTGSELSGLSPVPTLLLVWWWAVPVLSFLLGDWWRLVDPFDAIAAVVDRVRGHSDQTPDATVEADDWWVPAALLATFAWLVTCWLDGLLPTTVRLWLTGLVGVMTVGAVVGGRTWVRRCSPFSVLCGTVAAASPVDVSGGRVRFRSPFDGLAARAGGRRSAGVVMVVLGTAFWEAVSGTQWWADLIGTGATGGSGLGLVWSTAGLAWCVMLAGASWLGAGRVAEVLARRRGAPSTEEPLALDSVAALAPLAVIAVTAHQLSSLLVNGQELLWFFSADPLARGWDLWGTRSREIDESLLSPTVAGWVRLGFLAAAVGVALGGAWDRFRDRLGPSVLVVGWSVTAWVALAGVLALRLLLDA